MGHHWCMCYSVVQAHGGCICGAFLTAPLHRSTIASQEKGASVAWGWHWLLKRVFLTQCLFFLEQHLICTRSLSPYLSKDVAHFY
jgi:hypothetical protein